MIVRVLGITCGGLTLLCVTLVAGWTHQARQLRIDLQDLAHTADVATDGWGRCTSYALVKLDELEARRRANLKTLFLRGPAFLETEP